MSDRINYQVSATPIETLTTENSGSVDVIASEVGTTLGGGGDSINLANYSGAASSQGYADGVVNYVDCTHSAAGTRIVESDSRDFVFIKNTGHKYSSATVLGDTTTDCVLVTIQVDAYENSVQDGFTLQNGTPATHWIAIAWLKPGQAICLPLGATNLGITNFGGTANDVTEICNNSQYGTSRIYARTYQSDGSAATDGNAVEFLGVS